MIDQEDQNHYLYKKILSALFFAVASSVMTFLNKTVLILFEFPSHRVLCIGQMAVTLGTLWVCRSLKLVQFPPMNRNLVANIWPLLITYLGNKLAGLLSTNELSIPTFTALRRISILMTMILEIIILKIRQPRFVQASVLSIVLGAMIAAADNITFSLTGYILVLLRDVFSAVNGVYLKKMLNSNDLGNYGLLFYHSFFMIIPAFVLAGLNGDLHRVAAYEFLRGSLFLTHFTLSCVMGLVLSYSIMLCMEYNGALATAIIGILKYIFVAFSEMLINENHVFSLPMFVGLHISVVASLVYTFVTFKCSASVYKQDNNENVNI